MTIHLERSLNNGRVGNGMWLIASINGCLNATPDDALRGIPDQTPGDEVDQQRVVCVEAFASGLVPGRRGRLMESKPGRGAPVESKKRRFLGAREIRRPTQFHNRTSCRMLISARAYAPARFLRNIFVATANAFNISTNALTAMSLAFELIGALARASSRFMYASKRSKSFARSSNVVLVLSAA